MILKEHKKHTDLKRPGYGNFGRNEWAIVGGPCSTIKTLAGQVIDALAAKYRCAYADAVHADEASSAPGRLASGATLEYTDFEDNSTFSYKSTFNSFRLHAAFSAVDLVLVNGNHHQAKAQVVIIYPNKKNSLQKRIGQLTNVQLILLVGADTEIFDFVRDAVPGWRDMPVFRLDETAKIISFFEQQMLAVKPRLNGLVLAGGKSERMGLDKSAINWHGKEQRYHMADLLKPYCDEVFISCRADKSAGLEGQYAALQDTFIGLGPYGGILSAFREQPDSAWMVIACDLPLLSERTLRHLVGSRSIASIATAYQSSSNEFPEPLITIWEPKSYSVLLSFLAQGYSCPRKVLINSDVEILTALYPEELTNVNTPQDMEEMKRLLEQKITV